MKIQQQTIENREKLLLASMKLFSTFGYHNTNIRKITTEAGLSTGIFYHYFDNKESLYLALFENYYLQSAEIIQTLLKQGSDVSDKEEARKIMTELMTPILTRSTSNSVFISDADVVVKELPALKEVLQKGNDLLCSCFEDFLHKRYPDRNMNYKILARMIYTSTDAVGRDLSKEENPEIRKEYLSVFIDLILYYTFDL